VTVPAHDLPGAAGGRAWLAQPIAGSIGSVVSLAVILTLGLLAFAPMGLAAAETGIPAAFLSASVGGLVMALLARSPVPTAGPTSATAIILAGLVATLIADPQIQITQPNGVAALLALTGASIVTMGALQLCFGVLRLGSLARFVPQPALAGFMNGVAIVILINQVPPLLGLTRADLLHEGAGALMHAQPATFAVGLLAALTVWLVPRRWPAAPASLTGLFVGCAAYYAIQWMMPDVSLGAQAGAIAERLPVPTALLPLLGNAQELLWRHLGDVLLTGLLLAVIGSLETVLSVAALDQELGTQTNPNIELIANGSANLVCGALGGVPLAYLRARAIATVQAGGTSRLAAAVGCIALGVLYFVGAPLIALLPLTVLAGLMATVAFALSDRWTRQLIERWRRGDHTGDVKRSLAIIAAVCVVTVWLGFAAGVLLGVLLSALGFIRRMTRSLLRTRYTGEQRSSRRVYPPRLEAVLRRRRADILVLELEGALFFGNIERLSAEVQRLAPPAHLILDFAHVTTIDSTGAVKLMQLSTRLARQGVNLMLAGISPHNHHGAMLHAHDVTSGQRWAEDVDRALEQAERALLAAEGEPLDHHALPLRECDLLRGLDDGDVERVRSVMQERRLKTGERLFAQGDPGNELFVLTEGSMSIVQRDAQGRAVQRFISFSPGMMFGEVAVLDGSGRSADALADTDAVVYALPITGLEELERTAPNIVIRLYRNIAAHLSVRLRSSTALVRSR
jgi:MFS superfamily sulfate permease-like transporter